MFMQFFVHVTYDRGSAPSGGVVIIRFMGDILAHKMKLLKVAARQTSEAQTQPWPWRVGLVIPVAGSGRSGLLLAVEAY